MYHAVGLSHYKHLIQHCIMVDKALEDTWGLYVFQIFLTKYDSHLLSRNQINTLQSRLVINEHDMIHKFLL